MPTHTQSITHGQMPGSRALRVKVAVSKAPGCLGVHAARVYLRNFFSRKFQGVQVELFFLNKLVWTELGSTVIRSATGGGWRRVCP